MKRACLAILLVARVAFAQSPDVKQLYAEGQEAFASQRWSDAITAWRRALELSSSNSLHFNLAQAYAARDQSGDCALARSEYDAFIRAEPAGERRQIAEAALGKLSCPIATRPVPAVAQRSRAIIPLAIGAGGIALFATGLVIGQRASTLGDEVTRACAVSCNWVEQRDKDAAGRRDAKLGYALDVIGLAAVTTAAIWYVFARREVAISRVEGGGLVTWRSRW